MSQTSAPVITLCACQKRLTSPFCPIHPRHYSATVHTTEEKQ